MDQKVGKSSDEEVLMIDNEVETAAASYVVRFRNTGSVINYAEVNTGIEGYTHSAYGADAAYLGTNSTGSKVKFKLSTSSLFKLTSTHLAKYKSPLLNTYSL